MNRKTLKTAILSDLLSGAAARSQVKPDLSRFVAELSGPVAIVAGLNASSIRSCQVAAYPANPADRAALNTTFSSQGSAIKCLYLQQPEFLPTGKQIHIKTVNLGHRRNGQ